MPARSSAVTAASLAALLACTGLASGIAQPATSGKPTRAANQPANRPAARANADPAQPTGDMIYIYSSGLADMLSNEKDLGLRSALALVEGRLVELAEMSGSMPEPEKTINAMWTLAISPMELRIAATEPGENGEPPFALALTSRPEDAAALERTIVSLLRTNDVTIRTTDAGREFETPAGPARFALSEDESSLDLSFGQPLPPTTIETNLPDGYTPVFILHANLQNAQPLIEMALSQSPDPDQVRPILVQSGVLGEDAMIIDMALGHNDTDAILQGTVHNARARAAAMGLPDDVTLDRPFLSLIPADTTQLTAGVFDLTMLDQALEVQELQDVLAEANEALGIDIMDDIVHQIGQRFALYQSDRTGGGGILSSVVILELNDPTKFARAHRRLVEAANDFAAEQIANQPAMSGGPTVQVEIRPRRVDGMEFFTLTWPGLPIPAEISWTIHENHLMAALSPRSLVEALAQASGDGPSFADNPMLAEMVRADDTELLSVTYTDAPRFAVQGYSLVNLFCAGVSNALRTTDGTDPGIPLPAYNDFMDGIEPNISVSMWDGDDLVFTGRSDASFLVNIAGSSGSLIGPLAIASAAGAVVPAMQEARASATQLQAASNLRQILLAQITYAVDNNDQYPESIDDIHDHLGDISILSSPLGPCFDGSPDYAIRTDMGGVAMTDIALPATTLAAIDRASVLNGAEMVIVGFFDGHVESIYSYQLTDLLLQEENRGAYEAFALPDWMNPGF